MCHLHAPFLATASFQRTRHRVSHLEVGVRDVRIQGQLEFRRFARLTVAALAAAAARHLLELADDVDATVGARRHPPGGGQPSRAAHLDDLAARPAPPDRLQDPVGLRRRLGPALVREEQDSRLVAVVTQNLAGALAAALVIEELDHGVTSRRGRSSFGRSVGGAADRSMVGGHR